MRLTALLTCLGTVFCSLVFAGEPGLPPGLGGKKEPALPSGLNMPAPGGQSGKRIDEPALPGGLGKTGGSVPQPQEEADTVSRSGPLLKSWADARQALGLSGFWEARSGVRTGSDRQEKDLSIAETRLQLQLAQHFKIT